MQFQYKIGYRQKDGGWQYIISYKDHNGEWRQKSKQGFKRQKDARPAAEKRLEELKEQFTLQEQINPEYGGITFAEFAKMFLGHVEMYKEGNTAAGYRTAVKRFEDLDNLEMSEITTMDIQKCIDRMVREGKMPSTIRTNVTRITTMFSSAVKPYKIITASPVSDLTIPENKGQNKVRALTKKELDSLLNNIKKPKYYIPSLIAAKSGLRIGEIAGLCWDDINYDKRIIIVNKQWKKLKDGSWGMGPVKRKKSNREVPAPASLLAVLKKYRKTVPANIDGRIVPCRSTNTLSSLLCDIYEKVGFDITPHDLRHTYATLLLSEGVDIETVGKLLGHDAKQTMKTYSHVTCDMMVRAVNVADRIFG